QWIDDASVEFLFQCSKELKEYPILLLYSLRESLKKREVISESKKIRLLPLKNTESDKLTRSLIKENKIYQLMKDRIILTANGNPLFIEEIVREIEERRLLADKDRLGNYPEIFVNFQIPDTVQSIARARIDLLPSALKEILYQASVLGRDIEIKLLQKISNLEDKVLLEMMRELQKHEFLKEVKAVPQLQSHFTFAHSLIQEIAYNSLLFKTRRSLHNKIGTVMEEMYLSKIDAKVEELTYHFKNSDDKEKAVFYLNKSGDKAQSLYAFKNAINDYLDSIKILESMELEKEQMTQLSEIYNKLAFSQSTVGKRKEAESNLNKALKHCRKIKDKDNESLILMSMGNLYGDMGQWDEAIEYFKGSLLISEEIKNLRRNASILKGIGLIYLFKGDTSAGYSYLQKSINICKEIKAFDVYAMVLNNLGIYYDMLGRWKKAIVAYKESLSIAKKINNIIVISNIMNNIGFAYSSLGESKQAVYYLKESVKIATKIGDIYNMGINYIHLGEEYLKKDEFTEVKYYILKAEKIFNELNDKLGLADTYRLKAKLFKKIKRWKDSEIFFKKAIKTYSKFGDKLNEGETYYEWGD
ncbi:MAG: tetratricopeptide repeat protein, partial [Candidatus Lokiarchaeota archaeon]|nr:tetratricopeptide repeat protein [Candidatus Lokiarchaeota archaeon]